MYNDGCPMARCAYPEWADECEGTVMIVNEVNDMSENCCLKLCNYKCVLSEGQQCCDYEGNMPNEYCTSTCDEGLECVFMGEEIGAPTCMAKEDKEGKTSTYKHVPNEEEENVPWWLNYFTLPHTSTCPTNVCHRTWGGVR